MCVSKVPVYLEFELELIKTWFYYTEWLHFDIKTYAYKLIYCSVAAELIGMLKDC